jgi:hypothetical protein
MWLGRNSDGEIFCHVFSFRPDKCVASLQVTSSMNNVVCLKVGDKYDAEYVNKLYRACKRNLTIDFKFHCFTEDDSYLDKDMIIHELPVKDYPFIKAWWWKAYLHKEGLFDQTDTNLYIDLDMVIVDNIDKFFTYEPSSCYMSCLAPIKRKGLANYIFRWKGNFDKVWDLVNLNKSLMITYRSDQDYIDDLLFEVTTFFPVDWVKSYKWEIRSTSDVIKIEGTQINLFKDIKNPEVPKDTSIFAFHGTPTLDSVKDPIILKHWY